MSIEWAQFLPGNINRFREIEERYKISADPSGNIYIIGISDVAGFQITTPSGTITPQNENLNVFIAKYNTSGALQWAHFIDTPIYVDAYDCNIVSDRFGNSYITGYALTPGFQFTTASGTVTKPTSNIATAFIAKYNTFGVCQWAQFIDGPNIREFGRGITVDLSGNVYAIGINDSINSQCFVKYNSNGDLQWNQTLNFSTILRSYANLITTDLFGDIYMIQNTVTSGFQISTASGTVTKPSTSFGAVVVKYNSSGVCQWAQFIDGSSIEQGYGIATDTSGNVYVTGYISTQGFQIETASGTVTKPSTSVGAFIIKYNTSGACQWAQFIDGQSNEISFSITSDILNNIYITGYTLSSGLQITTASGTITKPSSSEGAFVLKYNSSGECQWAQFIDGSGYEMGFTISVDQYTNIYVMGYTGTSGYQFITDSGTVTKPSDDYGTFFLKYLFQRPPEPEPEPEPEAEITRLPFIFPPGDQSDQGTTEHRGNRALSSGYRRGPVDFQTLLRIRKGRTSGCC